MALFLQDLFSTLFPGFGSCSVGHLARYCLFQDHAQLFEISCFRGRGGGILGVNISLLTVCVFVWFCFMLDVVVSYHDSTLSIKYVQPHINFIILSNF